MPAFDSSFDSAFDSGGSSDVSLPIRIISGVIGTSALPLTIQSLPPGLLSGVETLADPASASAVWRPVVKIGGLDVSDNVAGTINITAQEGAARVASFTLLLAAGSSVNLPSWTGKSVAIDFAGADGSGAAVSPMRLFTGVIDTPNCDINRGTLSIQATDDLQGVCDGLPDSTIDSIFSGRWSAAVFDKAESKGWQRVQDVGATVQASFDLNPYRLARATPWLAAVADMAFDGDSIEDKSLVIDLADRASLINRVKIDFSYRFGLLRSMAWRLDFDILNGIGFAAFIDQNRQQLIRSAVTESLTSAGVYPITLDFVPLPTVAISIGGGFWIPNPYTDQNLCLGFSGVVGFDFGQTRDEVHNIVVENAESIDRVGVLDDTMSGALEDKSLDLAEWEQRRWQIKTDQNAAFTPAAPPVPAAGTIASAAAPATSETDRAAASNALETLIDIAKTKIAASHRQSRVAFTVPLNPAIDLDKVIAVDTSKIGATGKVIAVRHVMDVDSARAVSEVSIAITAIAGTGIVHGATPTAAAAAPIAAVSHAVEPVIVYDSLAGVSSFSITFPAIDDEARNTETVVIAETFNAPLIEDRFVVTA